MPCVKLDPKKTVFRLKGLGIPFIAAPACTPILRDAISLYKGRYNKHSFSEASISDTIVKTLSRIRGAAAPACSHLLSLLMYRSKPAAAIPVILSFLCSHLYTGCTSIKDEFVVNAIAKPAPHLACWFSEALSPLKTAVSTLW